jgi:hypothetical protein
LLQSLFQRNQEDELEDGILAPDKSWFGPIFDVVISRLNETLNQFVKDCFGEDEFSYWLKWVFLFPVFAGFFFAMFRLILLSSRLQPA